MLVVVYFCEKDWKLAVRNLEWCIHLEKSVPFECLLAYDTETPQGACNEVSRLALKYFSKVHTLVHKPPPNKGWPRGPNYAFQQVAWEVGMNHKDFWFWWEADATPLKAGWLKTLADAYDKGSRPFAGYIVEGMGHMNGVGIYPNKVSKYSQAAMTCDKVAWDVSMKRETTERNLVYPLNNIIQHVWGILDGNCCHNGGDPVVFKDHGDVDRWVRKDVVLIHRVKNTSLIDVLIGPDQIKEKLPPLKADYSGGYKVDIFIVSFKKHFPYLKIGLRSISKFCRGFNACHVFVPDSDITETKEMESEWGSPFPLRFHPFAEWPGKGMVHHEYLVMTADQYCDADFILHTDSDCIFTEPVDPSDYIVNGKPVLLYAPFEIIGKQHPPLMKWKEVTERAIGFAPHETMRRHPAVHIKQVYMKSRQLMESHTQQPVDQYIRAGRNEYPQEFCEFVTLGNVAMKFFADSYTLIDSSREPPPKDKIRQAWSHREFTAEDKDIFKRLGLWDWKKPDIWSDRAFGGDRYLLAEVARSCAVNGIKSIIETGTLFGSTTQVLAHLANEVHTVEKVGTLGLHSPPHRVRQWYGDSAAKIPDILPKLEGPVLIFLDAHDESRDDSPIARELEAIAATGRKDCILVIHDMKVPDRDYGHDTYKGVPLSLDVVKAGLDKIYGERGYTVRYNKFAEGANRGAMFVRFTDQAPSVVARVAKRRKTKTEDAELALK